MKRCLGIILTMLTLTILVAAFEPNAHQPLNLVAVLTDFGSTDYYAGALEGSIYAVNPSVRISTITHEIQPFDVAEGSYILAKSARWYPSGTVFMAEVNPGSGSIHRHIVLETKDGKLFIGPDNGLFTGVMGDPGLAHAYEITNRSLTLENSSETFPSLYIYGPVAARLAGGLHPSAVGPEVNNLKRLPIMPAAINGSEILGSVVHVDRYGNLITNIPSNLIERAGMMLSDRLNMTIGNQSVSATFVRTYGDVPLGDWLALIGSSGDLEIAINMENAAKTIGARAGDGVMVSKESES